MRKNSVHLRHVRQKGTENELVGTRSPVVVELKSLTEKGLGFLTGVLGNRGRCGASSNLEDGLQLATVRERMIARHHFDNEAAQ